MSSFWSWFIIILTVANILACGWLIRWTAKRGDNEVAENEVLEHTWDGDLREYNNPMPYWWLMLFYISIVFGFVYLALYPGLGSFRGYLGWSQTDQYEQEIARANDKYGAVFQAYSDVEISDIAADSQALQLGRSLYMNNCTACHGSDARGVPGFPNLADNDWLYGGEPNKIYESILYGRNGLMPPMGAGLDEQSVDDVAAYVRSLSGLEANSEQIARGSKHFQTLCVACHGSDGRGNQLMGAPNLTDNVWLHGSSAERIGYNVREGVKSTMPAHEDLLGEDKVRLLAGFVYSLSQQQSKP